MTQMTVLNMLRQKHHLPPFMADVKLTKAEVEEMIETLQKPMGKPEPVVKTPETTQQLFAKLNVLRKRAGEKALRSWKGNRKDLEKEVEKAVLRANAKAKITIIKPAIAKGSDLLKEKTDLHKNPLKSLPAGMDKILNRERRDTAKRISLWAGFSSKTVLHYLECKNIIRPVLKGEELKADIKAHVENRDKALPRRRGKAPDPRKVFAHALATEHSLPPVSVMFWLAANKRTSDKPLNKTEVKHLKAFVKARPKLVGKPRKSAGLNPAALAALMKIEPRTIRIKLRKIEAKIPKGWLIAGERWGFKSEHKADIVKLLGG